ncbi:hypothetical protein Fmac_021696 [Flemingia macrophylla]|uniref:QWRF motif-containing protein 3 n=1 Tax=Flemingia macrophylla TaxID=520843 RepID=A0ABD1LXR2_9FABA
MKSEFKEPGSPYCPKPKTRQVSSRFMTPISTGSPPGSASPLRRFHRSEKKNPTTLADHIGDERLKEREENHNHQNQKLANRAGSVFSVLTKQRSCRELKNNNNGLGENDQDVIGRSPRNGFSGNSFSSPVAKKPSSHIAPGRLSLDENTLKRNFQCSKHSIDSESDNTSLESVSLTTNWSSRKTGKEVPSKYMATRERRGERSDSEPHSSDDSWMMNKFITQKAMKKANSLIGYMSSKSQWALSPGRSGSTPSSFESKEKSLPFSNLRPPHKRMEKILNMGFDLFRTKKSSTTREVVHQLRLLNNRLIQWRLANARAHAVNHNMSLQAECNLIYAMDALAKLRHSVMQKKIEFEREKLEMKLNFVLHSQMKLLEMWGCTEGQHLAAITEMKEFLYSVVCKVPLLEGAKVDIQLASIAQQHAFDLADSIKSVLSTFSSLADETAKLLSELARVVIQEKLLLQEFNDIFHTMSVLELKERSLNCSLIQLKC